MRSYFTNSYALEQSAKNIAQETTRDMEFNTHQSIQSSSLFQKIHVLMSTHIYAEQIQRSIQKKHIPQLENNEDFFLYSDIIKGIFSKPSQKNFTQFFKLIQKKPAPLEYIINEMACLLVNDNYYFHIENIIHSKDIGIIRLSAYALWQQITFVQQSSQKHYPTLEQEELFILSCLQHQEKDIARWALMVYSENPDNAQNTHILEQVSHANVAEEEFKKVYEIITQMKEQML